MKSIAIFCASAIGNKPIYAESARETGKILAEKGIRVVFGGSKLGLMGAVANGALDAGGEVIGVLPDFMERKEVRHDSLTELIMVESMHHRKLKMHELSDGVIALPGGFGTFEELFELLTWSQLGLHNKPIGILNVDGYYDKLIEMFDHMCDAGLLKETYRDMIASSDKLHNLLAEMMDYQAPPSALTMLEDQT